MAQLTQLVIVCEVSVLAYKCGYFMETKCGPEY